MPQCVARMASGRRCTKSTMQQSERCASHQISRWNPHTLQSEPVTQPVTAWRINQCTAVRKSGVRCLRTAPMGETLCSMHRAQPHGNGETS